MIYLHTSGVHERFASIYPGSHPLSPLRLMATSLNPIYPICLPGLIPPSPCFTWVQHVMYVYIQYIYNIRIYIQCMSNMSNMSNMSTILCPAPGLRRGSPGKLCPVQRLPERTFCQICGSELKSCWDYHKIMLSGLV